MSFVSCLDKMQLQQNSSRPGSRQNDPTEVSHNSSGRTMHRNNNLPSFYSSMNMGRRPSSVAVQAHSVSEMDTGDDDDEMHLADDENNHTDVDQEENEDESYTVGDGDGEEDETINEEYLMAHEHWSRGQLELFRKVRRRGSYPVFPANWMLDFSNLPDELFVQPGEEAMVGALDQANEVKAILAFDNLMQLGGRVRDKMESGGRVEPFIRKEITRYIEWAMKDGGIRGSHSGVFAISGSPDFEICEMRMQKRISELAERHRNARETARQYMMGSYSFQPTELPIAEPPPANIYGFAIVGCVVAMVSLNTGHLEAPTRTLLVLDYSELGMDVWNAIAIALMVVQARNEQVERAEWGRKVGGEMADSDA